MSTEIAKRETGSALTPSADMPEQVFALFQQALSQGEAGAAALATLVDVQDRIQRRNAELAFSAALSEFQRECPPIRKDSTAKIASRSGSGYEFTYADLETIIETVRPYLSTHGFSFTFDSETDGATLRCTCILRHASGHRESSSFRLPTESASGATPQQKVGGALTYAKRQTLVSVLGLSLTDPMPEPAKPVHTITDEQAATLDALIDEVHADRAKFYAVYKIEKVADLPATLYAEAVRLLEAKRKGGAK